MTEHAKHHVYSEKKVEELTRRKQIELLRGLLGVSTEAPNVYTDDLALSRVFNSKGSLEIKGSNKTLESLVGAYLQYRNLTVYSAPEGTEFITGDNYVIPMLNEVIEDSLAVPFHNSTEFLMPLSPSKVLFVTGRVNHFPGIELSRKTLPANEVKNFNDIVGIFSSAHLFSRNETARLIKHATHSCRNVAGNLKA